MIDTHCHLNLKALVEQVDLAVKRAKEAGVEKIVVPGTDIISSKKAVELAQKYDEIYAAVGMHPHHVYQYQVQNSKFKTQNYDSKLKIDLEEIEELLNDPKVVAVGEVGIDKYYYGNTKYSKYMVNPEFIELQKLIFLEQIKLAIKYQKSLIIHSREGAGETLKIIGDSSILDSISGHIVFHCCEANDNVLRFALAHRIYIGVDGDVTYSKSKEEFVKKIPIEFLVLETDAPFLLPEPLRSEKKYPNQPKNISLIAEKISEIKNIKVDRLIEVTDENAKKLFIF